jgi:hypothetical protein
VGQEKKKKHFTLLLFCLYFVVTPCKKIKEYSIRPSKVKENKTTREEVPRV